MQAVDKFLKTCGHLHGRCSGRRRRRGHLDVAVGMPTRYHGAPLVFWVFCIRPEGGIERHKFKPAGWGEQLKAFFEGCVHVFFDFVDGGEAEVIEGRFHPPVAGRQNHRWQECSQLHDNVGGFGFGFRFHFSEYLMYTPTLSRTPAYLVATIDPHVCPHPTTLAGIIHALIIAKKKNRLPRMQPKNSIYSPYRWQLRGRCI
jgi:hypothetical protein